jgi:hypothetical protein
MSKSRATLGLIDHVSTLADPRQAWKVVYPLPEIMLTIQAATLASADAFVEIEEWGNANLPFLRGFLAYAEGIPSHDALNDLVNALDPEVFKSCFSSWVATLADAAPIEPEACQLNLVNRDGKTSRRTHARSKGRNPLHLVSASWIGVGIGSRRPLPPNRTCGFLAYGSPVGGYFIETVSRPSRLCEVRTARQLRRRHWASVC